MFIGANIACGVLANTCSWNYWLLLLTPQASGVPCCVVRCISHSSIAADVCLRMTSYCLHWREICLSHANCSIGVFCSASAYRGGVSTVRCWCCCFVFLIHSMCFVDYSMVSLFTMLFRYRLCDNTHACLYSDLSTDSVVGLFANCIGSVHVHIIISFAVNSAETICGVCSRPPLCHDVTDSRNMIRFSYSC